MVIYVFSLLCIFLLHRNIVAWVSYATDVKGNKIPHTEK